jgi:C4-dicarboxylate-specific signal transduction histidine kinase
MHKHQDHMDPDARKAELLREGEYYRAGVEHAKAQIKHGARPEIMFHNVIDHATWALRTRADALLKPTGTSVSVLAPYALTLLGFIRKRRLGKPALAAAALLGAAGWYYQRKRAQEQLAY